jgi:arylsulfatase A-like enzyme
MPSVVDLPHQCDRAWRGVRTETHKLVLGPDDRPWLLFDLKNDPYEERNLVSDPASAGLLSALLPLVSAPAEPPPSAGPPDCGAGSSAR